MAATSHEFDLAMNRSNDRTLSMGLSVLLYLIRVAVFQFQSSFMHFHVKQRQLTVQYLQGVGFLRRYKPLLLKSFISGAAVLVLGLNLFHYPSAPILLYVLVGIVVDLMILIRMIRRFERKRTTPVLKEA